MEQHEPVQARKFISKNSDHELWHDSDGTFSGQVLSQKFGGVRSLAQAQAFIKDKIKEKKVTRVKTLKDRNRP